MNQDIVCEPPASAKVKSGEFKLILTPFKPLINSPEQVHADTSTEQVVDILSKKYRDKFKTNLKPKTDRTVMFLDSKLPEPGKYLLRDNNMSCRVRGWGDHKWQASVKFRSDNLSQQQVDDFFVEAKAFDDKTKVEQDFGVKVVVKDQKRLVVDQVTCKTSASSDRRGSKKTPLREEDAIAIAKGVKTWERWSRTGRQGHANALDVIYTGKEQRTDVGKWTFELDDESREYKIRLTKWTANRTGNVVYELSFEEKDPKQIEIGKKALLDLAHAFVGLLAVEQRGKTSFAYDN